ncbi:MAG: hypothetical protein ABWY92_09045 [Xanthobacteraceae bacterium]|jgi:hypothetical protein
MVHPTSRGSLSTCACRPSDTPGAIRTRERLPPTRGFDPIGSTPEEFDAQIKAEIEKWAKIVRDANVKTQLRVECASVRAADEVIE